MVPVVNLFDCFDENNAFSVERYLLYMSEEVDIFRQRMIGFEMDEMVSESLLNGLMIMHAEQEEKERIKVHLWNDERDFTMLRIRCSKNRCSNV